MSWLRTRGAGALRFAALLHFAALIAIRLVYDADDFNNWDLISFTNAYAFESFGDLLGHADVHFRNPFSFPNYNTGAESVLSLLVHRAMAPISLYWSNSVVVLFYDVAFLVLLSRLLTLLFRDAFNESIAWMLLAMSPVLLTFPAISAFNMQGYVTILAGLLGSELLLQGCRKAGSVSIALSFLFISQAYPLSFFLPLFCMAWGGARGLMILAAREATTQSRQQLLRDLARLALVVLGCVAFVELASDGSYLGKAFGVVSDPLQHELESSGLSALPERLRLFFRAGFLPETSTSRFGLGFAPYFLWMTLALLAVWSWVSARRARPVNSAASSETRKHSLLLWTLLPLAAWTSLVVFGYLPSLFGTTFKSQRCFFGDFFLALAVASFAARLLATAILARRTMVFLLTATLALSDLYYLQTVFAVNHARAHEPVFDYDPSDGWVRHEFQAVAKRMREQADSGAGLVISYPRGLTENTTDPSMFHARFLRAFGGWRGEDVVFRCRFCSVRYGCPFPEVRSLSCKDGCCPVSPSVIKEKIGGFATRKIFLWWFTDLLLDDELDRWLLMASLHRRYEIEAIAAPTRDERWSVWELRRRSESVKDRAPAL